MPRPAAGFLSEPLPRLHLTCAAWLGCRGGLHYGWEKTPDSKKAWISAIVASGG